MYVYIFNAQFVMVNSLLFGSNQTRMIYCACDKLDSEISDNISRVYCFDSNLLSRVTV